MARNWSRISRARCGARRLRKARAPQFVPERGEQVRKGNSRLGGVPGTDDPGEGATLLEVSGRPEQDQAVDQSREGSGAGDGLRGLVLGLAEPEVLFAVIGR